MFRKIFIWNFKKNLGNKAGQNFNSNAFSEESEYIIMVLSSRIITRFADLTMNIFREQKNNNKQQTTCINVGTIVNESAARLALQV